MPLPASWTLITVTGTYARRDNGAAPRGSVVFASSQVVIVDGNIIVPNKIVAELDADGSFEVQLPSTNDPDLDVTGWAYTVIEKVEGLSRDPWAIFVPYDGGDFDLSTASPVVDPGELVGLVTSAQYIALAARVDDLEAFENAGPYIPTAQKGAANGVAPLDSGAKIDAAYLPSYVDDVVMVANYAALPGTGETSKIYVTEDTNASYRWTGAAYVSVGVIINDTDDVPEGATNKYFTEARVLATVLTGLSLLSAADVSAADTVLVAMGKLQAQNTAQAASIASNASAIAAVASDLAANYLPLTLAGDKTVDAGDHLLRFTRNNHAPVFLAGDTPDYSGFNDYPGASFGYSGSGWSVNLSLLTADTSGTNGSFVNFFTAKGTNAAPALIANGQLLGGLNFMACDGAAGSYGTFNYIAPISIYGQVVAAPGASNVPADLIFDVGADGAGGHERFRIGYAGHTKATGTFEVTGFVDLASNIPTTSPLYYQGGVTIGNTNAYGFNTLTVNNVAGGAAPFYLNRARGTPSVPLPVQSGDAIGDLWFGAWDGSVWQNPAYIECIMTGAVSSGVVPADLVFYTGGSVGGFVEHMRLSDAGGLSVTPTPGTVGFNLGPVPNSGYWQGYDGLNYAADSAVGGNIYAASAVNYPYQAFYRSRGTTAAQAAVQNGDTLASLSFWGHDGAAADSFIGNAYFNVLVDGAVSAGNVPAKFVIGTDGGTFQLRNSGAAQFSGAISASNFSGSSSGTNTGDQSSIVGISGTLAEFNAALTGADFATGGGTATGTNTGDQTSIVGISGTKAQFDTACSDDNFAYVGTANTFTATQTVSTGKYVTTQNTGAAAFSIEVSAQPAVGIGRNSTIGGLDLYANGSTPDFNVTANAQIIGKSTAEFGFTSGTVTQTVDTRLTRRAAATFQFGAADAAAPVAQTLAFQGARGGTDTNTAAVTATIQGSLGTGTGTVGDVVIKTGTVAASGTTQHTAATRLTINSTNATYTVPIDGPAGASNLPALTLSADTTTGWYRASANTWTFTAAGARTMHLLNSAVRYRSDGLVGWSSSTDPTAAADTGCSRNAAGVVEINNGTAGTYRDLKLRDIELTGTKVNTTTGTIAFQYFGTTVFTLGNGVLTMGTATAVQWSSLGSMNSFVANSIQFGAQGSNSATGQATTRTEINKAVSSIADATATTVFTVTVPNAAHSANIEVTLTGSLGAGGAIGANEATGSIKYNVSVARTAGVNAVATISTAWGSTTSAVAGATTITVTGDLGAVSGAVGASNTFTIRVTITKGGGSSANHTCVAHAVLLNANATGITIA